MTTISVYAGTIDNTNTNIEKSIKNTITSNYDNVLNYHNDKDNKYFVSGNSKYTFDYDKDTKTLIVYTNSKVDAIFIDDVKQKKPITKTKKEKFWRKTIFNTYRKETHIHENFKSSITVSCNT